MNPYLLKTGDLIYITSPSKSIDKESIDRAVDIFQNWGFKVLLSNHCLGSHNYFSGTEYQRIEDIQFGIDNPEVKAIICSRGGYGCIQIVDKLDWSNMLKSPKWLIGFSDITILHQRLQNLGIPSIHGPMPITFSDNTSKSLALLNNAIRGIPYSISTDSNPYNINGVCQGELIGGNLSILYSLLGTNDQIDYEGKILFIEDLDEFLYHIDHMLFSFQKADIFSKINGLIVGGMTNLRDTSNNFGINIYEIILKQFQDKKIPIAFDFPSGHIDDNIPMVMGKKVELSVLEKTKLRWI